MFHITILSSARFGLRVGEDGQHLLRRAYYYECRNYAAASANERRSPAAMNGSFQCCGQYLSSGMHEATGSASCACWQWTILGISHATATPWSFLSQLYPATSFSTWSKVAASNFFSRRASCDLESLPLDSTLLSVSTLDMESDSPSASSWLTHSAVEAEPDAQNDRTWRKP